MVVYIKSDLEFILKQIKIAEDHALYEQSNGTQGKPLFGVGLNGQDPSIPTYNLAWGLRTVDGTYNNLLNPQLGAADNEFPEPLGTQFRTIMVPAGPGGALVPVSYAPGTDNDGPVGPAGPSDVFDPHVRTISNLIVDQTLGNPSAILTGLQRAGIVAPADQMTVTAQITAAYEPLADEFKAVQDAARANAEAQAASSANPANPDLAAAAAAAAAALAAAQATLDAGAGGPGGLYELLATNGIELDGPNVVITNTAPDEGLSAPFNSWFTLFGQFFDHGLDLVAKGGNGTVFIPLMPDDPLYVPGGNTNFMVLTRATLAAPGADGIMNDDPLTAINEAADNTDRPVNTTTSFVDQNQTYTSHPSHQVFLREYVINGAGDPVATGRLIEGGNSGMATWADLKAQAADILGIQLVDANVGNVPLLATDQYGNFIPGANGFPQIVTTTGLVEGDPAANGGLGVLVPANAILTGHAFLADIAHNAVPDGLADGDIEIGLNNPGSDPGDYDNELLDAHYIAGDGRANENIGLTAVHHVFHSEHNRLVEHTKSVVIADAQAMLDDGASQAEAVAFLNEWLIDDVAEVPAGPEALIWDGERLFQAAKFGTEMQYQHLVFEEFARKIQPNINVFLVPDGYDVTLDPSIVAEFAHVVYRFGHSMLTETIDRFDPTFTDDHIGLIEGFLNPLQFENNGTTSTVDADISAGAIIRGMTRQVGNQIDEFVTSALRNNLLGLPLDLATINLARGRDTGVPSLNAAREQFYAATNQDALLKPYESWVDFAGHLKNEASIINFIASYGTHDLITSQTTLEGKRDAALTIITGVSVGGLTVPADATDFLNATGAYAGGTLGGLNNVDLWIGGLAEAIMPFGGMLGSTFNFVFEVQMENLQSGDRFYYLQRLDGLHLFGEMENNSFASLIMRNTNATHLPSDVFSTPGLILEVDQTRQFNDLDGDGTLESTDPVGSGILTNLVIRNDPSTTGADTHYLRYTGGDHVVLGGTDPGNAFNPSGNDTLIAGIGDDTLFGDGGNDKLEGGFGNDIINAGAGDDIIKDSGGDDNIKAGAGNDVVHAGPGLDLVMGNDGQDFIFLGTDMGSEVFAGTGNDFIYGNKNAERILGNEGNDWIETGTFDGAPGDNFDEIFAQDGIDGHDVFLGDGGFDEFIGEGGDDIMVGSAGRGKMVGMSGFDWATYKDNLVGVNADLSIPIIFDEAPTLPQNAALDEYESMEGLSGTKFNDVLKGTQDVAADRAPLSAGGTTGYLGSVLDAEGIALIAGLQEVLGAGVTSFDGGDIILGGDGSDTITGNAGDDIIDGDKWLDVQIGVFAANDPDHTGTPSELHSSMTSLAARMFSGEINPGRLSIVRTIRDSNAQPDNDGIADVDRAVFSGARAEYDIDFNPDGTITVAHTGGLANDGTDTIRNVEVLDFTDQDLLLQAPTLDLNGDATVTTNGQYADNFNNSALNNSTGTTTWATSWAETGDNGGTNSATAGQITIDNGANVMRFGDNDTDAGNGTATIQRTVNLAGVTSATVSYSYAENSFDAGEIVTVTFSDDGSFGAGHVQTVQVIDGASGSGNITNVPLTGTFTANAAIRFVVSGTNNSSATDAVSIDNLSIATTTTTVVPGTPGNNYETTYNENAAGGVAIAAGALITDDGATIASARVVLTNASAGDVLSAVGLPGGIASSIDTTVPGQIILNLTGTSTLANYRTAIQQVRYSNSSENPNPADRILQVSVNDGLLNSNIATATVHVVPTNDAPAANNDTVITNVANGANFSIAVSALLANDTDPEGSPVTITAVNTPNGLNAPTLGATAVTVSDTGAVAGGSFNYIASDGTLNDPTTTVTVNRVGVGGTINGTAVRDIIVGDGSGGNIGTGVGNINGDGGNDHIDAGDGNDVIGGGTGDDIVLGGTGNDTVNWNATDGFDIVDGGAGSTDTFQLTGNGDAETFRIYARAAAIAAGVPVQRLETEIVITRTVGLTTTIIAELDNIEEIRVNTLQVTSPGGVPPGGTGGNTGDTIQVIGNFNAPFTSLNFSTITIDGNAGDDTIDISSLDSAHRIVFRSNGGHDTIVGTLRPQDVIELLDGATVDDYVQTVANGVTTLTNGDHSISYVATGDGPQIGSNDDDEDDDDCGGDDDDTDTTGTSPVIGGQRTGTPVADVLTGNAGDDNIVAFAGDDIATGNAGADVISAGEGADFVSGGDGRDVIFAGAGDDQVFGGGQADVIYGDAGADRIFGDGGNDLINAGAGDDAVFGGAGDDLIVAEVGDGSDVYFGDDSDGGTGVDTLDMSAVSANVTVNLGSGPLSNGTASSSQTGNDTIWGIENVNTGSGNDTITASNAVNAMNGGAGNDTFKFTSTTAANGDTIVTFEPGDRIDLTGIDANIGTAGDQSFTLVTGAPTAAGQLGVTFETRADGDFTVVQGNIDGNAEADFTIEIAGHQNLTNANLGL
jgi:Ca2+-binding RTX toxin-like protein